MIKRFLLITTGIIAGIVFILPLLLFGILNAGNAAGLLLSAILLFYGLFFEKANRAAAAFLQKKAGKGILSVIVLLVATALIFTAVTTVNMVSAANNPPSGETAVVVLGCKVNPSGPSLMLTTRLEATLEYLNENPSAKCILSGGQGPDEPVSEAQAMQSWLVARGIDKNRLYMEDKSTSTWENLRFSKELIQREKLCPAITVITNEFHQYRARTIAESYNIESYSFSAKTPLYLLPTYYVREIGGILTGIFA